MFISNSRRFIFIHLFKTGGTSVEHALNTTLQWNDLLLGSTKAGDDLQKIYTPVFGLRKHSTAREVRRVVGETVWKNYFTFSLVRNPFAQVVSQFTFARDWVKQGMVRNNLSQNDLRSRNRENRLPNAWPWKYHAVRAFVDTSLDGEDFSAFIRSPRFDSWQGMQPFWTQLCNQKADHLIVDYVARLETIDQEWPTILEHLKIKQVPLERKNSSPSNLPVSDYYKQDADADFVLQRYEKDFKIFDYSTNPAQASSPKR